MILENWQYSRGDIYYANMEPHVGSEQGGERPVVVLQNDTGNKYSPTLIIATLTSRVDKKRHLPTHVLLDHNPGLKVPSIVQLEQIFTLDKQRVQRFVGRTSEKEMNQIEMAIKISLAVPHPCRTSKWYSRMESMSRHFFTKGEDTNRENNPAMYHAALYIRRRKNDGKSI